MDLEAARDALAAEVARRDGGALAVTGGIPTRGVRHQSGEAIDKNWVTYECTSVHNVYNNTGRDYIKKVLYHNLRNKSLFFFF